MKTLWHKAWSKFLIFFGELKLVKWFPWIQYDPVEYKVTGQDIRRIMFTAKPGDILLRRYDGYVDNWFINGDFSHAGIYVGDGKVIHAVHPNVRHDDVIDFCRCDRIMILRPKNGQGEAVGKARQFVGRPYDFDYECGDDNLYCFELAALCYPGLSIPTFDVNMMFGILSRKGVYLGKSFIESPDFTETLDTAADNSK